MSPLFLEGMQLLRLIWRADIESVELNKYAYWFYIYILLNNLW